MRYSRETWKAKRDKGLGRYLLFDGVVLTGGPFAVLLQVLGYFFFADDGQTFGQYYASPVTWGRFFLHGATFGLIMGYIMWRRNERVFAANEPADEKG